MSSQGYVHVPQALSEACIPPIRTARIADSVRGVPDHALGVVGFCFGGGLVWQLLAAGEPRLAVGLVRPPPVLKGLPVVTSRLVATGPSGIRSRSIPAAPRGEHRLP